MNKISSRSVLFIGVCLLTVIAQADTPLTGTPGVKSFSDVSQHLEGAGNTDPLDDKSKPPLAVSGVQIKENLPEAGKYFRMTVHPGKGGYPGVTIGFDAPVDFSAYDMLGVWFKSDTAVSYFQIVPHGVDAVMEEFSLASAAARNKAFVKPGVWHLAFIPFKTGIGWVRNGKQMDWTKIKEITFYIDDAELSTSRPDYNFEFGGMALYTHEEAKARYAQTQVEPEILTAAKISSGKDASVWTADVGEKIFKDSPCPKDAPSMEAASTKAAGHEYALLQWVVKPSRNLKAIEASGGDLVSEEGRIPASNIQVRYVDYIETPFVSAPDPLPLLNGKGLPAEKEKNFIVWAMIYVPAGTPKGIYRGELTLKDSEGLNLRLPARLEVYGFALPVQNHLKSLYTIQHVYSGRQFLADHALKYWGRNIAINSEDYKKVLNNTVRVFGEHRITPELQFVQEYLSHEEMVALQKQYGFDPVWSLGYNFVHQGYIDAQGKPSAITPKEREEKIGKLKAAAKKYEAAGEIDLTYIKISDEPTPDLYGPVAMAAQDVKTAIPNVLSFVTITTRLLPEALFGLINTWCPLWGKFDFESPQARERKAAGDRFWTYGAEYRTNDGYEPMDLRVPYWLYWKYGITGVHFSHHRHSNFLTYPNDTYPHSDGLSEIPSIRFEMIRQGIQDYEYLWILNDLIKKSGARGEPYRQLLELPLDVAQNDKNYTRDPALLLRRRDQIARAIEDLTQKQVSPPKIGP